MKLVTAACVAVGITLVTPTHAFQQANTTCEYGTTTPSLDTNDLRIVSTFHSMGITWRPSGLSPDKTAHVLFKELGSNEPARRSLDLVYVEADTEYRGSIVHLKSGTDYVIALMLDGVEKEVTASRTWCEQFPIAETVIIPTGTQTDPYEISDVVGSPEGYILYTADPDSSGVLDGEGVSYNIRIENSAYVIVRGLRLQNAQQNGIFFVGGGYTHDIVIENNVIENWGRVNQLSGFGEPDYAIRTVNGRGTNYERLIIQRNVIHNPRGDTNSWAEYREDQSGCSSTRCHPKGPGGVYFRNTAGNHVIRYNEISSTNGNYLFDGLGGSDDISAVGAFNRDTDIYGNIIENLWDDAIESEGGNANVRIWGNYIDNVFTAFGAAVVDKGPLYIFRNVVHRTQRSPDESDNSGVFVKNKTTNSFGGGHVFVFNNTVYRHNQVGGVSRGIKATSTPLVNFTSRNNIIDAVNRVIASTVSDLTVTNDFDYDLYQGTIKNVDGQEQHGIEAIAVYDPLRPSGSFVLAEDARGVDAGDPVPNFTDLSIGAPDMGAEERGGPLLEFGIVAYNDVSPDPIDPVDPIDPTWELPVAIECVFRSESGVFECVLRKLGI